MPRDTGWHRVAIGPVRRHRVIRIRHCDDSSEKGYFISRERVRIPLTVNAFVMMSHDRRNLGVCVHVRKDPLADLSVTLHLAPLVERERSILFQEASAEADFSNVVNQTTQMHQLLLLGR